MVIRQAHNRSTLSHSLITELISRQVNGKQGLSDLWLIPFYPHNAALVLKDVRLMRQ